MSTALGSLLLQYPQFKGTDLPGLYTSAMNYRTNVLALQEAQRQQQTAADVRAAIQQDPALQAQLFGGGGQPPLLSTLGGGGGPPGAITQQAFGPSGPGETQTVPASMDLSQFATGTPGGGMPPPALASLSPQSLPRSPSGGNPLLALAQRNPDAALLLQKQMQGQEDMQLKRQSNLLTMREKVAEHFGQLLGAAHDQASYDQVKQQLARVSPEWASALPQVYSKEGVQPFIDAAISAKDRAALQVQDLQAQAAVIKARKEGRSTDVDNQLRAMGVTPGQETPAQMRDALQAVEDAKVRVAASHGTGQIVQTPQGYMRINPRTNQPEQIQDPGGGPLYPKPTAEEQRAQSYGDRAQEAHRNATALEDKGITPGIWEKGAQALPFGVGNYLVSGDQQKYKQAVSQFAQAILRKESGAAISPTEYEMTDKTYFPQPGDSKEVITQKRSARENLIQQLQAEGKQTGRQAAPSGGPPSTPPRKPV